MSLYHDVMEALTPLIEAFERLGITYYIGGSVSSSLHGMARRTQDVDAIADIRPGQVRSLVQALQSDYYVDEQAWQDAVRRGLPYNDTVGKFKKWGKTLPKRGISPARWGISTPFRAEES